MEGIAGDHDEPIFVIVGQRAEKIIVGDEVAVRIIKHRTKGVRQLVLDVHVET